MSNEKYYLQWTNTLNVIIAYQSSQTEYNNVAPYLTEKQKIDWLNKGGTPKDKWNKVWIPILTLSTDGVELFKKLK